MNVPLGAAFFSVFFATVAFAGTFLVAAAFVAGASTFAFAGAFFVAAAGFFETLANILDGALGRRILRVVAGVRFAEVLGFAACFAFACCAIAVFFSASAASFASRLSLTVCWRALSFRVVAGVFDFGVDEGFLACESLAGFVYGTAASLADLLAVARDDAARGIVRLCVLC